MSSFRARLQTIMILSVIVMCLGSPGLSLSHTCGQCVGDVVGPCFFTDGTCAPTLPDGSCPESSAICTCLRCSSQCVDNTGSCVEAGPSITSVAFGGFASSCPPSTVRCAIAPALRSLTNNSTNPNLNTAVPAAVTAVKVTLIIIGGVLCGAISVMLGIHVVATCTRPKPVDTDATPSSRQADFRRKSAPVVPASQADTSAPLPTKGPPPSSLRLPEKAPDDVTVSVGKDQRGKKEQSWAVVPHPNAVVTTEGNATTAIGNRNGNILLESMSRHGMEGIPEGNADSNPGAFVSTAVGGALSEKPVSRRSFGHSVREVKSSVVGGLASIRSVQAISRRPSAIVMMPDFLDSTATASLGSLNSDDSTTLGLLGQQPPSHAVIVVRHSSSSGSSAAGRA